MHIQPEYKPPLYPHLPVTPFAVVLPGLRHCTIGRPLGEVVREPRPVLQEVLLVVGRSPYPQSSSLPRAPPSSRSSVHAPASVAAGDERGHNGDPTRTLVRTPPSDGGSENHLPFLRSESSNMD